MGTATGMSEDDGGRRRQGSPRTPGDCGKPLFPEVAGDAPTAGTHSSQKQDHAPRAECDRPGPKQCTGSREARPWRVGTFKSPGGRGLSAPPLASPRPLRRAPRLPGAALRGRGRWAGGWASRPPAPGSGLKDRETKGRNPASSCGFPPARQLPTSRDQSRRPYPATPSGPGRFQEK